MDTTESHVAGISNNGLAGLFSTQFVVGIVAFIFTVGTAYNALQAGQESNKKIIDQQAESIRLLQATQINLIKDSAKMTATQDYILQQQQKLSMDLDRVRNDINEILKILTNGQ